MHVLYVTVQSLVKSIRNYFFTFYLGGGKGLTLRTPRWLLLVCILQHSDVTVHDV